MLEIADLITFPDLAKLPKNDLKDMCTNMSLESSGSTFELARSVWSEVKSNNAKRIKAFTPYYNKLLAGRTSISWFECDDLTGLSEEINKNEINPFQSKVPFKTEDLTTIPILRSAAKITDTKYYLRFIYKDGTRRIVNEDVEVLPTTNTATAYIDEDLGLIEIRENPNDAQKIAEVIAGYIRQQLSLNKTDFIKPYGYHIDKIADILNGELYESKASPETWMDTFNESENEAIIDILRALDNYFEKRDIDNLQEKLDNAATVLGEELLASPFIAIILAGMGNVGLKVNEHDLRNTAMYQLLQPYLQPSGGYIRFNVEEDGVEKTYTIQVGVESKSIYFRSNATTEIVLKNVRDRILSL